MDVRGTDLSLEAIPSDMLAVVVGTDFDTALSDLDAKLGGGLVAWLRRCRFGGSEGASSVLPTLGKLAAKDLLIVGCGKGSARELRVAAGKIGREARAYGVRHLAVQWPSSIRDTSNTLRQICAGNYVYERYRNEESRTAPIEQISLVGGSVSSGDVRRLAVLDARQSFARDLVNAPPADLYPESFAAAAAELAGIPHVEVEVWDQARLRAERCVGILAVGRGSARPGRLIHLRYRPPGATRHVALVGKGVTYDSGGMSLKPTSGQLTMRCDMGGAATVLAAGAAVAELGLPVALDVFIGAVENMCAADSYKLGDILSYPNGVTVEVHNTDAEGRLVMADCLIRACQTPGVTHVVDAATLTGACAIAVGSHFAGLFTTSEELATDLGKAAAAVDEGLWRLPLHKPYGQHLKADWGQIKNLGVREGGASIAASFLEHFVTEDVEWAHLDIAASSFIDKADSRYAAGGTGEGVATLVAWLESFAG